MVDTVPLNVKWNKESFKIDFVIANGVKGLKDELEEKTGVPADRMKLMPKSKGLWKGVLKDDKQLGKVDFAAALEKEKSKVLQVLLVGSAEKLKEKPKEEAKLPPMKEEAKLPPMKQEAKLPPAQNATKVPPKQPAAAAAAAAAAKSPRSRAKEEDSKPAASRTTSGATGGSTTTTPPPRRTEPATARMQHPDEIMAYQTTEAWLKQTPPSFLYPQVVPSIVNLRDLTQQPLPPMPQEQEELSLATPRMGKDVLNHYLQMLEVLDKEEQNLILASPWTVPLTQIVTQTPAGNPQQALQQLQDCGSASPRKVCQYPFKKNDIVVMCRTCQADETCAMCHACFTASDHEGHDVQFFQAQEGGCCDCGDPDAWDPKGFCPKHGEQAVDASAPQQSPEELLPPGLITRVKGMVPAIMDWMVNQFVETAKASFDRTMLSATAAETTLGTLGREGHGLYLVVQADDVHQSEYVDALRQFLGSSSYYDDNTMQKLSQTLASAGQLVVWGTMELATECGRDQTRAWIQQGDPYTSQTIASVMVQRVQDLKRRGLPCRIMTLKELQQEQNAIAIIQWLSYLAFSCDPICQTVATYIDEQRHLVPMLEADFIISSRFTKTWYSMLLNLLSVPDFKSNLGAAYCDTYEKLTEECAKGKGILERSAYSLSVQFLNRDTYVLDLVANRDLLSKLGKALLATLKAAEDPIQKTLKTNHVVLSNRRYTPVVSDLNYVINVKGVKRLVTCQNGTFLKDLMAGLSLAQCMDTHSWRHWDLGHVEEEDMGWYNAFNLSLQLGSLFERILSFDDDDPSPVQDPKSPYAVGLLTSSELCYQVLTSGLQPWHSRSLAAFQPTPFSSAADAHKRRSASLPYSTIATKHGTCRAFRQLPVSQVSRFSLHLPLHRFFAACIREVCLRPGGIESLLTRLRNNWPKPELDDMYHGLLQFPIFSLSRAAQVKAGLWRRNGPGLNDQVNKYADPAYCRSMRDADMALAQLAVIFRGQGEVDVASLVHLLLHRLGLFEFAGLAAAPNADPSAYEEEVAKGLYPGETGEDNGGKAGLVFPWTYTPARDASDCRALVEEFLYFVIVFTTELPPKPPTDKTDHTNQAKLKLKREVIHRLAASPKTHSELADVHLVLSHRENMLLSEEGKTINPDDATAAMLGQTLSNVAERKASRSRLEPDKFVLLKSAWDTYDPSFFHLSVEGHQTAAESRPVPSSKDDSANGMFGPNLPYCPRMPEAHPSFTRLRRDVSADAVVCAVAFRILHMHCRGSQRTDIVDLPVGRLAYDSGAKSETSLARAVHLLTLGCFAWESAKEGRSNWQDEGGGSPGSIFCGRESAPTTSDWVAGALLRNPKDLLDCSWYEGEENTLLLLKRLAVDGGASGVFTVQDPAAQAGAAWICEFAVQHCPDAAKLVGKKRASSEGPDTDETEMERRKRMAQERALKAMNAQAAKFANLHQVELKETGDDNENAKQETDFERRKREARERALAHINRHAAKFAESMGIKIEKKEEGQLQGQGQEKTEESDFDRRKREARERALANINRHASKFAESIGIKMEKVEEKAETETERRKREAKEKALAKINANAAKFSSFIGEEFENDDAGEAKEGDAKIAASSGSLKSKNLRKERPQCIICSDSDAECFVAFSQGSSVLRGGGGPSQTGDNRMTNVRKHAGVYIALCGHAVHNDCIASYLAKVRANDDQASSSLNEFRCPLCQRPSNCLVPYVDASVDWIDSPTCLLADKETSNLNNFLTTTPWWISRHQKDALWDGHGSFQTNSADSKDDAGESEQLSGEVMVIKALLEHLNGIAYETDAKRLGEENLPKDLGEFRHYFAEKQVYQNANIDANAWPACLFPDQQIPESRVLPLSRERFIAQLLMSIQTLVYSTSCETFDARRHIADTIDPSTKDEASAAESDAMKSVLSKFGIGGSTCQGQLILMPAPSPTEDDGSQPFYGRFGRLRNFGLSILAAAGAVGVDLVQLALQLPTSNAVSEPGMAQRAPIVHPILLGHVLTHVIAAICTCCGATLSPEAWRKSLRGKVSCLSTDDATNGKAIDTLAGDCEGFLKLGFMARVLQVLCGELGLNRQNALEMRIAISNLQPSDHPSSTDLEREWIQSCQALLLASLDRPESASGEKIGRLQPADKFQSACMVAAEAASAYLADAGAIIQLLVPGIMARYSAAAVSTDGNDSSLGRLQMLRELFSIESIDEKMMQSTPIAEVVRNWFGEACRYMQGSEAAATKAAEQEKSRLLLPPQNFRSWDWPLESVRDYSGVVPSNGGPPPKSALLLGGYNFDLQPATSASRPCIDVLPPSYMELYAKIGALKPDAERTAVCLICGEALDASGNGACTKHSYECGAGTGLFFLLQDCVGLILHRGEGSFIHSIYVDNHGETPRGRPLYLDLARYNHLRDIYMGHQVRQQVLAERESTQQGVLSGYY